MMKSKNAKNIYIEDRNLERFEKLPNKSGFVNFCLRSDVYERYLQIVKQIKGKE